MPKKVLLVSLSSFLVSSLVFLSEFHGGKGQAAQPPIVAKTASLKQGHLPSDLRVPADVQTGPSRNVSTNPKPNIPSPSLTAAYPELKARPSDWHQFNRETETLAVSPVAGVTMSFARASLKDEGKYVTWFGTNKSIPGSSLVAVATPSGGYDAIMILPGMPQFSFHTDPDGATTAREADPGEEGCGVFPEQPNRLLSRASVALFTAATAPDKLVSVLGSSDVPTGAPAVPAAATIFVDVLFVYDSDTLAAAASKSSDAAGYIDGYSKACLESGNVILNNSLVTNFQWRYLGAVQTPDFTQTDKLGDDLAAMDPSGAIYDWVKNSRYQKGADQVILWHGNSGADFGGIASSNKATTVGPDYATAVVAWPISYKSVIHELAHNFGCQHDRAHANYHGVAGEDPVQPDGDGYWCYGVLWSFPVNYPDGTSVSYDASTIMGYGSALIPYYSNPSITVHVSSQLAEEAGGWGDWGFQTIGFPVGDPKAAYNAKVLSDNAAAMAAIAEAITVPVITTQPANVTSVSGSTFSLTMSASGGGLSYQWYKDGLVLAGATATIYAKAAISSDAGNYTVTATNSAGSATSNSARVTVTSPPAAASGSGGGGGGGGSFDFSFVGALAALTAVARFVRSRPRNEGLVQLKVES